MRQESKEHNEKATEEAENGLHHPLTWDISMSKIYFVLWQTLHGSQNIRLGKHSSLVSLPLAPPRGCRAIPCFPLCLSTQMNATVGFFFFNWKHSTYFSRGTFCPIEWRSFLSLTEIGVIWMATPQLLAWVKGSELKCRTFMTMKLNARLWILFR